MITFTVVLKASSVITQAILKFAEDIANASALEVVSIDAIPASAKPVIDEECHFQGPPGWRPRIEAKQSAHPVPPITASNPFVTQAVESSSMRKRIQVQKATPSGRNRVVYEVTGSAPEGATIRGVPASIMNHLTTYAGSHSLSAKDIEVQLGMKRKSVESALYLLRTLGVVQSIAI